MLMSAIEHAIGILYSMFGISIDSNGCTLINIELE